MTVFVVDVGQGDATVVVGPKTPAGSKVMLIDAGPPGSGELLARFFSENRIDHVDYAIVTHFDLDHLGGFVSYHENQPLFWTDKACTKSPLFPRSAIYDHFAKSYTTAASREWNRCVSSFPGRFKAGQKEGLGDRLELGGGFTATIIAADGYVLDRSTRVNKIGTSENARSIMVLLSGPEGDFDMLIPGDATGQKGGNERAEVEVAVGELLAQKGVDLEILRVAHHGARNTCNPKFIETAKPEVAIISVGNHQPKGYRHPDCLTYQTLERFGVEMVLQTERGRPSCSDPRPPPTILNDTIRIVAHGAGYHVSGLRSDTTLSLDCTPEGCNTPSKPRSTGNHPPTTRTCCKICKTSQPCGDTCISSTATCNRPQGCACSAR